MKDTRNVLIVASTASMIKQFNLRNITLLKRLGYRVFVATNFAEPGTITAEMAQKLMTDLENHDVVTIQVDFGRASGTVKSNMICIAKLRKLFSDIAFDFVHVHSALASVLTRVAAVGKKQHIIYTIHGMQFFKGGSIKRWVAYFPVEWMLSGLTKLIITINQEDTGLVKKWFINSKTIEVPGVGIDYDRFSTSLKNKAQVLKKYGLSKDDVVFISVGELSDRKNHLPVISAINKLNNKHLKYFIVGIGPLKNEIQNYISENGLTDQVKLLGYRESDELNELLTISDFGVFPSKLEGLMTAGLEVMAAGIPLLYSGVRGISDYSEHLATGYNLNDVNESRLQKALEWAIETKDTPLYDGLSRNCKNVAKKYDKTLIDEKMLNIYENISGKAMVKE